MKKYLLLILLLAATGMQSSPISPDDKRIEEIKKELGTAESFPESIKLYYRGRQSDFAVFYDLDGNEVWYRYRRNKFDYDAEETIVFLVEGSPYLVTGEFTGMMVYPLLNGKIIPSPSYVDKEKLTITDKKGGHNIPVYKLKYFKPLAIDEVIF